MAGKCSGIINLVIARILYTQLVKYPCVLFVKPSNKVYLFNESKIKRKHTKQQFNYSGKIFYIASGEDSQFSVTLINLFYIEFPRFPLLSRNKTLKCKIHMLKEIS